MIATPTPAAAAKPTVLLVDDLPDNLAWMALALRAHYRTVTASSGLVALALARACPRPDLIVLDVMMPVMDGHEVCRLLKADADTAAIPVIFLTAHPGAEAEQRARALGAAECIAKPVARPELLARVKAQIERQRNRLAPAGAAAAAAVAGADATEVAAPVLALAAQLEARLLADRQLVQRHAVLLDALRALRQPAQRDEGAAAAAAIAAARSDTAAA